MTRVVYFRCKQDDRVPHTIWREPYRFVVKAKPQGDITAAFREMNQWCFDEIGPEGWGYTNWDFYFESLDMATSFKLRWG
jgi:hypothetical protein